MKIWMGSTGALRRAFALLLLALLLLALPIPLEQPCPAGRKLAARGRPTAAASLVAGRRPLCPLPAQLGDCNFCLCGMDACPHRTKSVAFALAVSDLGRLCTADPLCRLPMAGHGPRACFPLSGLGRAGPAAKPVVPLFRKPSLAAACDGYSSKDTPPVAGGGSFRLCTGPVGPLPAVCRPDPMCRKQTARFIKPIGKGNA